MADTDESMHTPVPGYEVSTSRERLDIDFIHGFLSEESYWARGVPKAVVQTAVENSLCFGVHSASHQVGFARVITDSATFALLADVLIDRGHRGQGLSKWLMWCVVNHEDLQGLRRLLLLTSDAHGLYRQFGFGPLGEPARFMEILRPKAYAA